MSARRRILLPQIVALFVSCVPSTEAPLAPLCPGAFVRVSAAAAPVFEWPSGCGVSALQVTAGNNRTDVKWSIATPDQQPNILPPVTYGQVPAGLNQAAPAAALVSGTEYRMNLLVAVDNVASTIASVRFTQP